MEISSEDILESRRLVDERNALLLMLESGTAMQRRAALVFQLVIRDFPAGFGIPFPVGTIPLDIDIPGSDLDIATEVSDIEAFRREVQAVYGQKERSQIRIRGQGQDRAVVCLFEYQGLMVEIFGQKCPLELHSSYRHMRVEGRLLDLAGDAARRDVRRIKMTGLKTEPAFAQVFKLRGDPYQELYELFEATNDELSQIVVAAGYSP